MWEKNSEGIILKKLQCQRFLSWQALIFLCLFWWNESIFLNSSNYVMGGIAPKKHIHWRNEQKMEEEKAVGSWKKSSAPFCNESDALLHCVVPTRNPTWGDEGIKLERRTCLPRKWSSNLNRSGWCLRMSALFLRFDIEQEPSPQNKDGAWHAGSERSAYAFPLMERSACSMRRLPLLTGRRFNFNREDGKGRIKSKVSYHVQIKLVWKWMNRSEQKNNISVI